MRWRPPLTVAAVLLVLFGCASGSAVAEAPTTAAAVAVATLPATTRGPTTTAEEQRPVWCTHHDAALLAWQSYASAEAEYDEARTAYESAADLVQAAGDSALDAASAAYEATADEWLDAGAGLDEAFDAADAAFADAYDRIYEPASRLRADARDRALAAYQALTDASNRFGAASAALWDVTPDGMAWPEVDQVCASASS